MSRYERMKKRMYDLAYMIESADIRLPNACPELPDMENEQVSEPGVKACLDCGKIIVVTDHRVKLCAECRVKRYDRTVICEICGKPFKRSGYSKAYSCPDCKTADFAWKEREFTTSRVKDATREAMRHGMSYGQYMMKFGR